MSDFLHFKIFLRDPQAIAGIVYKIFIEFSHVSLACMQIYVKEKVDKKGEVSLYRNVMQVYKKKVLCSECEIGLRRDVLTRGNCAKSSFSSHAFKSYFVLNFLVISVHI